MITLQETLRAVFYAPFYAALSRNAFAEQGIDVRFVSSPTPDALIDALLAGTVDVGWGGPMRVNLAYHTDPATDLKCFAEIVTRDPFFLVTRTQRPPFTPAALMNLRLATVAEVPTPWLCLQHDIRLAGLDPTAIPRITGRTMADNAAALLSGEIDVVQLFEPYVEELVERGCHIWYAAADRGPCSYTTLYARAPVLAAKRNELIPLIRALVTTLEWLKSVDDAALATAIQPYFPDIPHPRLAAACARYRALGIWSHTPILPQDGYARLLASLRSAAFVNPGTPYAQAVDNTLAQAAQASSH